MNYASVELLKAFERQVADLWEAGDLPFPIHLAGGNEEWLVDFFKKRVKEGDWIFSTHRPRHHALCAGVAPEKILQGVKNGHPLYLFDKTRNFYSSSILGGTCGIAAGVSWAVKQNRSNSHIWCFIGDGAEDNGHLYEAVMMVEAHFLPCTFIIEDNNRSVNISVDTRTGGQRMTWPPCVIRNKFTSTYPHAGSGSSHHIEFKKVGIK